MVAAEFQQDVLLVREALPVQEVLPVQEQTGMALHKVQLALEAMVVAIPDQTVQAQLLPNMTLQHHMWTWLKVPKTIW